MPTATAETPAAAAGEKKKLTASHYLVIAPLVRSMERDGVPRCALHEVSIECEGKVDVPGLEHFRAALVPSTSIQETQIVHKFLRLSTQLIAHEDSVPAGWRRTPLVHKKGKWGVRPTFGALDALRPGRGEAKSSPDPFADRFVAISKIASEHGFEPRSKDEKDWHFARRAQQFLNSRVLYDAAAAGASNDGKAPATCIATRVAHCGHFSSAYRELLSMGGVECRSAIGEWVQSRGMCHCVNDVFLEGCGWIPVEPAKDSTAAYDTDAPQWGPPSFLGHPSFGVCDDMLITDHFVAYNEHANDAQILLGGGDSGVSSPRDNTAELRNLVDSLFERFDENNSGTLDMHEARKMIATLLNVNEHWSGADAALNETAHALDLHRDGTVSKHELITSIANNHRGVAHLLMSASKQVKMGQSIAQVRPVFGGAGCVDGVVKGKVGNPITCVGHGLMAQYEACKYTAGKEWLHRICSKEHIVFHETNGKGESCAARQLISDAEATELFEKIEARCNAAFAENYGGVDVSLAASKKQ